MAEAKIENTQGQDTAAKLVEYEKRIQAKDAELDTYKSMVKKLEEEVEKAQTQLTKWTRDAEQIDSLKNESEHTLTRAKGMILERAKIIKNQELQLEAYGQQIESLKDVIRITKDLLEIRNLEVKQLEVKINCMEDKMKAEKERQDLMHKKLETMIRHNGELKREYEAQLALFTALRERYNERELARGVIDDMRADLRRERGETVTDGAQNTPAAVAEEAKHAVEAVVEAVKPAVEAVAEAVKPAVEAVEEAVRPAVEAVIEAVKPAVEAVVKEAKPAVEAVKPAVEAVEEAVKPAVEAVVEAVKPAVEAVAKAVEPAVEAVEEAVKPAVEAVVEAVKPAVEAIVEVSKNTAEPVVAVAAQKPAEPVLNSTENAAKAVEEQKKE